MMHPPLPSAATTLVVFLGASEYSDEEFNNPAFANSAKALEAYFRDIYHLPENNLRNLFNEKMTPSDQLQQIEEFIKEGTVSLKQLGQAPRDLILYYVGHGGFSPSNRYQLFLRYSRKDTNFTKLEMEPLATTLKEKARHLRRIIILDCCFAANAQRMFASPQSEVALKQTRDLFEEKDKGIGFPQKGTSLLCATNQNDPAITPEGASLTAFTEALLDVLNHGNPYQPRSDSLSLRTVNRLMIDFVTKNYQDQVPHPGVYSPDQSQGDIADIPLFPNIAYRLNSFDTFPEDTLHAIQEFASSQVYQVSERPSTIFSDNRARPSNQLREIDNDPSAHHYYNKETSQKRSRGKLVPILSRREVVVMGLLGLTGVTVVGGVSVIRLISMPHSYSLYTYHGHSSYVSAVVWSHNGKLIASGSDDRTMQVWDATNGALVFRYRGNRTVWAVAWSHDGKQIAAGNFDTIVQVWDTINWSHVVAYHGHTGQVRAVAWSPDNTLIASGGEDQTVQIWDVAKGRLVSTYNGHYGAIYTIAWSPNGKYIASAGYDTTVQIWNASDRNPVFTYTKHAYAVNAIAWSPDGKQIVSADSNDYAPTAHVWNVSDGSRIFTYKGHSRGLTSVAWAPDGRFIASGSSDKTAQIWSASNGEHIFTYYGHSDWVNDVNWSPDGKYLVSSSNDKTAQIWRWL